MYKFPEFKELNNENYLELQKEINLIIESLKCDKENLESKILFDNEKIIRLETLNQILNNMVSQITI